jgi:hypothetical protein
MKILVPMMCSLQDVLTGCSIGSVQLVHYGNAPASRERVAFILAYLL